MKAVNESVNKADYSYPYIGIGTSFENNPLHFHNELEILCVLEGEIVAKVNEEHHNLKKGDICIILPRQVHTLLQIGQIRLCVIKLFPLEPISCARLESFVFPEGSMHYDALRTPIDEILSEDAQRRLGYTLAVQNACGALTLYILRALSSKAAENREKQTVDLYFFKKACTFIEENYESDISLALVSAFFGYSNAYFSRRFKAVCGMNFFDYLSIFRLKKSTELLQSSDHTIESIAFDCGYNSLRSYNRAFRKHFGQSPGSYRKHFSSDR